MTFDVFLSIKFHNFIIHQITLFAVFHCLKFHLPHFSFSVLLYSRCLVSLNDDAAGTRFITAEIYSTRNGNETDLDEER